MEQYTYKEIKGAELQNGAEWWADGRWHKAEYINLKSGWMGNNELAIRGFKDMNFLVRIPVKEVSEKTREGAIELVEKTYIEKKAVFFEPDVIVDALISAGYLSHTQSKEPPKMTDQQIKREVLAYLNEVCDIVFSEDKMEFGIHMVNFYRNWLRKQ